MRRLLATALFGLAFAAPAMADTRAHSGFSSVHASGGVEVNVAVGPEYRVEVSGPDASEVITRVDDGRLVVRTGLWRFRRHAPDATVSVTMPGLDALDATGGGEIRAHGVDVAMLRLQASAGADLVVEGACGALTASASSGASIRAQELRCSSASVRVTSGAEASVFADGVLNVEAHSGGDVFAYGDPAIGEVSQSAGGAIHRR